MNEDDFDVVVRTHLKGTFALARHACVYWRERSKKDGAALLDSTWKRLRVRTRCR